MSTTDIKSRNHFKLEIAFKDKIHFESELSKNGIQYHLEKSNHTRYFFLDENRNEIDDILKETGVIASTDTIPMTDYSDLLKVNKLYLFIALVVIALFGIGILFIGW